MCQRLCKLLGKEMSYLASGKTFPTSELAKAGNTIGLLFATDYAAYKATAAASEETKGELKDLRDSLVQLHAELKKRSDACFEVVLIPMNQAPCPEDSPTGIKQFFSHPDCPFLLISSEQASKIQGHLIRKYEIKESPSLILLEAHTTDPITFDGKDKALNDPKGIEFPWKSPSLSELLEAGPLLINKSLGQHEVNGTKQGEAERKKQSFVKEVTTSHAFGPVIKGVLFAAFWCPPCRSFLTALIQLYENVNKEKKRLEVIFVSSDRSQESFDRFFSTMPWLAIPFEDENRRALLTKTFNVKAIPTFTLLDDHNNIITSEGRSEINDDLEGVEFPWYPRLVDELRERHSSTLNNCLCVIYFTDDSDTDYDSAESVLNQVAAGIDKSSIEDALAPRFFVADDSDFAESLRIFMDLEDTASYLVIMDVENFRYALQTDYNTNAMSEASVNDFLSKFQTNNLVYKYMQSRFI